MSPANQHQQIRLCQPVIAGAADMELAQSAEKLYRGGVIADGIPSCASCHGPAGEGIEPVYPRLSGQHAEYTASSLRAYASGERENSIMQAIATKLSDEQITSLAAYISGLAP
jgi:cytochrome c553